MESKVCLEVIEGSCRGQRFEFGEQDTFMIGRNPDCNCIVKGDNTFSRHHLFLEINQSNVTLKDLGSLNGTRINGRPIYDGRGKDIHPEEAVPSPPQGLRDGDRIEAGNNVMILHINGPAVCVDCGQEIPAKDKNACEFINGAYLCLACRKREDEKNKPAKPQEDAKPENVRMNVKQREIAEQNPAAVLEELVREFLNVQSGRGDIPEIQGYTELKRIGAGGFGIVYKARRKSDGATVALKTMLQTRKPDRRKALLFEREKEIIGQLKHPNIIRSASGGIWNDIHFIEMDFADGGSIWDMMEKGNKPIDLKVAVPLLLQMLEGLAYAHEVELTVTTEKGKKKQTGVIHRDLKPPNVLLAREGGILVAKLSDFGLAKAFGAAGCTQGALSQTGAACGTPPYMAPEHVTNYKYIKPATDVFEMAATIFHMITGQFIRPMRGQDPFKCVVEVKPRRVRECMSGCPKSLADVLDTALAWDEKDRYPNGRMFLNAMEKAL
ncbi:MAG TPA: FHA domain-containing serine/threonine-protein kinase [Candidatus Hydrogenedentes bacterium]|nr:FHA domain-containing serine/threonine-protein kinase [Candidatus Hydrogenedentota bacterium]